MRFDFSDLPLKSKAFSELPMTFVDPAAANFLASIMDLAAIETGNRTAREHWQQKQLQNLLAHATQRSNFWKKRIDARKVAGVRLAALPIQTRADVIKQVESEGPLLTPKDNIPLLKHSTSGSSGTPVEFFATAENSKFNVVRLAAQNFMEGRDFSLNRTRLIQQKNSGASGFSVQKSATWLEPLQRVVQTGANRQIAFFQPDIDALCRELEQDAVGYLIAQPRLIDIMLQHGGIEFFKRAGTAMVIPVAEAMEQGLRDTFASANIPVRANYSSEEAGLIAAECADAAGHFHVATSNVIVEIVADKSLQFDDKRMGRVIVTHLHSYATPFVRYDVGDVAMLDQNCPCGHDGPVLSNIHGRSKSLIKHADERISIFLLRAKEMTAIAKFNEYRIRQTDLRTIVVEIGGRGALTEDETQAFAALVKSHAGEEFDVRVSAVAEIDWGRSAKRLGFYSHVV